MTRQSQCRRDEHLRRHCCFADDAKMVQMHRPMMFEQRPPWPLRLLRGISFLRCRRANNRPNGQTNSSAMFENNQSNGGCCRKVRGAVSEVVKKGSCAASCVHFIQTFSRSCFLLRRCDRSMLCPWAPPAPQLPQCRTVGEQHRSSRGPCRPCQRRRIIFNHNERMQPRLAQSSDRFSPRTT